MRVFASGVLAGLAKVGLVVVSIGGLSAGAYFAYQVGPGGGSDGTSVQVQPTLAVSSPTAGRVTPTATVEPATPQPTPPAIDTSGWEIFASPLGFDIRYPNGWTIVESPLNSVLSSVPLERVKIFNPIAERENRRLAKGPAVGSLPTRGAAWLEIFANPLPSFDEGALMRICGTESQKQSGSASASVTTVAGRPAILCVQRGLALGGELSFEPRALWINVQGDKVINISSYMVEGGEQDVPLLEAALSSTAFR